MRQPSGPRRTEGSSFPTGSARLATRVRDRLPLPVLTHRTGASVLLARHVRGSRADPAAVLSRGSVCCAGSASLLMLTLRLLEHEHAYVSCAWLPVASCARADVLAQCMENRGEAAWPRARVQPGVNAAAPLAVRRTGRTRKAAFSVVNVRASELTVWRRFSSSVQSDGRHRRRHGHGFDHSSVLPQIHRGLLRLERDERCANAS